MRIDYRCENNQVFIHLIGELGNFEARQAMVEIEKILVVHKTQDVILDLSGISFMDSSGIAVVMKIFKTTKDKRQFNVINVPSLAMKIFGASGVNKFVSLS